MKHPVLSSAITGAAVMGAVGAAAYAMTSKNFKSQRRQMKRSLEQTAASRDRDKADDGWLKDLKPEEVKILGDIIKEYLA